MNTELEQLKETENNTLAQLVEVRRKIQDIEDAASLPSIKEKYEGGYFKNTNGVNFAVWPMYFFCKKILSKDTAIFDQFQVGTDNGLRYEFKKDCTAYLNNVGVKITKEEYETKFEEFKNAINKK